jgi:hypothetical protein
VQKSPKLMSPSQQDHPLTTNVRDEDDDCLMERVNKPSLPNGGFSNPLASYNTEVRKQLIDTHRALLKTNASIASESGGNMRKSHANKSVTFSTEEVRIPDREL